MKLRFFLPHYMVYSGLLVALFLQGTVATAADCADIFDPSLPRSYSPLPESPFETAPFTEPPFLSYLATRKSDGKRALILQPGSPEKALVRAPKDQLAEESEFYTLVPRADRLSMKAPDWRDQSLHIQSLTDTLRGIDSKFFPKPLEITMDPELPKLALEWPSSGQFKSLRNIFDDNEPLRVRWLIQIASELLRLRQSGQLPFHGNLKPDSIYVDVSSGDILLLPPSGARYSKDGRVVSFMTSSKYNPYIEANSKADAAAICIMLFEFLSQGAKPDCHTTEREMRQAILETGRLHDPSQATQIARFIYSGINGKRYGLQQLIDDLSDIATGSSAVSSGSDSQ